MRTETDIGNGLPKAVSKIDFGGKGGNRTLDPGIMRDMDALYTLYIQLVALVTKLAAGK